MKRTTRESDSFYSQREEHCGVGGVGGASVPPPWFLNRSALDSLSLSGKLHLEKAKRIKKTLLRLFPNGPAEL